jgi:glutamate-ammonia-ligase adenylyltransferase
VPEAEATRLAASYRALRTLEHRLQMRRDEQTHAIPRLIADRHAVARLCGCKDAKALEARLNAITEPVATSYDRLIRAATPDATPVPADPKPWLKQHHPGMMKLLAPLIANWRQGKYRALKSESARADFEAVLPLLLGWRRRPIRPRRRTGWMACSRACRPARNSLRCCAPIRA